MSCRTWTGRLFASVVAIAVCPGAADAGLLPVSVTVQPEAGHFRWTYSVVLPSNMALQSGSYFTLYDFTGYVRGSGSVNSPGAVTTASNWTITRSNTGPTPSGLFPQDFTAIPNLTFAYTGPTVPAGQIPLGNFTADSTSGAPTTGAFTAINPRAADGIADANLTSTLVPVEIPPPISTSEPATLVLAGLGLPPIGLARSLRRKPAAAVTVLSHTAGLVAECCRIGSRRVITGSW